MKRSNYFIKLSQVVAQWILAYDFRIDLYPGYRFRPWRLVLLTYALPGVVGGLWLLRLPESPKFLLSIGHENKALEIVKWIRRQNKSKNDNLDIDELKSEATESNEKTSKGL